MEWCVQYLWLELTAMKFLIAYVIGIPVMFGILLYRFKNTPVPISLSNNQQAPLDASPEETESVSLTNIVNDGNPVHAFDPVQFLHEDYRNEMYYYELIMMMRRLLLVTGAIMIPFNPWQALYTLGIILLSIAIQTTLRPFKKVVENFAELLTSTTLFGLVACSWVVAYQTDVPYLEALQNSAVVCYLIVVIILFVIIFVPILALIKTWLVSRLTTTTQ